MGKSFQILSLDGGGIKGLLGGDSRLSEKDHDITITDHFD
jgi:patatin-like phospholipase/acyl hydrolase